MSDKPVIGIIVGSVRTHDNNQDFSSRRKSDLIASWVMNTLRTQEFIDNYSPGYSAREDLEIIILDLINYFPFDAEKEKAWREKIESCDAYLIVAAEYNHSFPGALKVALDLFSDRDTKERKAAFKRKPVGIVGLGFSASGVRAVQQLKIVMSALGAWLVQESILISLYQDMADNNINIREHLHSTVLGRMMDEIMILLK